MAPIKISEIKTLPHAADTAITAAEMISVNKERPITEDDAI
jgi:hypothetical protein